MTRPPSRPKRQITPDHLAEHLSDQLGFLEASCDAFDLGSEGEAKRIALTIRVLIHNTDNSHALLAQIRKMPTRILNTASPMVEKSFIPQNGLAQIGIFNGQSAYFAPLDGGLYKTPDLFESWWNDPVFKMGKSGTLSRRLLVLTAANQDGGAHVDPNLDEAYYRLSHENRLGVHFGPAGNVSPMGNPVKAAIRQIAHELLKTLKPGYKKMPVRNPQLMIGGMVGVVGGPENLPERNKRQEKFGRNEPCWCGSGSKYKHCHGRHGDLF